MRSIFRLAPTLAFLFLYAAMTSCASPRGAAVCMCSMVELIANPEKHDGKRVRTEGVATIGFESDRIFLTSDAAINGVVANALDITLPELDSLGWQHYQHLHLKYVVVEGTFRMGDRLTWGSGGSISDLSHIFAPSETIVEE